MADIIDLAIARERRNAQVRLLSDAIMLGMNGVDITDHLEILASMELFEGFREVA
jgi:hypothetical protein